MRGTVSRSLEPPETFRVENTIGREEAHEWLYIAVVDGVKRLGRPRVRFPPGALPTPTCGTA